MLSLKKINDESTVICKINHGKYDESLIYYNPKIGENNEIDYNMKLNSMINKMMDDDKYFEGLKGMDKKKAKQKIREHLIKKIPPINDNDNLIYENMKNDIIKEGNKEIFIIDGEMIPYTNKGSRDIYYICAPSGAGKSYFVNMYAKSYKEVYPKNNVYLFSKVENDVTLKNNKDIQRIELDEEIIEEPITPQELENSLTIFDDTMMIPNKELRRELNEVLLKDLMETGRHNSINLCITNHLINDYKKTRDIMNEATHLVFFLFAANTYAISYCLKNYVGMDKNQIKKLLNLKSRWVIINKKTCPLTIIYQNGVYLLNKSEIE